MRDTSLAAEALASWLHGPSAAHVSAHFAIDLNSVSQLVPEASIAWAAGHTANQRGIHIELAGWAKQTNDEWHQQGQLLNLCGSLIADIASRWSIPIEYVNHDGLLAGKRGVTTHHDCTLAWHETNHFDPGEAFPIDEAIGLAMLSRSAG